VRHRRAHRRPGGTATVGIGRRGRRRRGRATPGRAPGRDVRQIPVHHLPGPARQRRTVPRRPGAATAAGGVRPGGPADRVDGGPRRPTRGTRRPRKDGVPVRAPPRQRAHSLLRAAGRFDHRSSPHRIRRHLRTRRDPQPRNPPRPPGRCHRPGRPRPPGRPGRRHRPGGAQPNGAHRNSRRRRPARTDENARRHHRGTFGRRSHRRPTCPTGEEPAGPGEEPAGEGCDPSNTPPVWRPSRIPEHWAPSPPTTHPHPHRRTPNRRTLGHPRTDDHDQPDKRTP